MFFVYRLAYAIAFVAMLPYMLYMEYVRKKKMHIMERLWPDIGGAALKGCCIVHAVSVGETYAIASLVQCLAGAFPKRPIVVTSVTHTGHSVARKLFPNMRCLFLPFDFIISVRRFFSLLEPELVIISEGDIWPEFLHQAKGLHARVVIVNGSISDRTFKRLCWSARIACWRFRDIDFFCVQNQLFARRLQQLGFAKELVSVTGNMKADCYMKPLTCHDKEALRGSLGLARGDTVIVVGSTHDSEEEVICSALLPFFENRSDIKILIVPRHPERFLSVYETLSKKFSKVSILSRSSQIEWNILVIDAMGMLDRLYQIANVAIVAGSFAKAIGGHNIVEPALAGIPVFVGPYMYAQKALIESADEYKAVIHVEPKNLCREVSRLINNPQLYSLAVSNVQSWVKHIQGATERTFQCIQGFLESSH